MIPAEFSYAAPRSIEEAIQLLASTPTAKILGGGMSLIPALKHRMTQPTGLVDLSRIPGLDTIRVSDTAIHIGGCATHAAVLASEAARRLPVLSEAASVIGDVQVRNRGTFGGSLVHADPAADWPAVFLALDGEADVVGPKGKRTIKAQDFFKSMLTSDLSHGEILTEVRLPLGPERTGSAYVKLRQPASGFAIVGVAVRVSLDTVARITSLGVGITGVNGVPFRAKGIESRLVGQMPDSLTFRSSCGSVSEADPMEDIHASADYRRHLLAVFAARALARACERALA